MQLTSSGEVAVFLDDDQFASGESQDKCGPEAVAVFWHSVKVGETNPYTSHDIHTMASGDYQKFIGSDISSDHNGTSNQVLYDMLNEHRFVYKIGPADITWVADQLKAGYPVIIGIVESSVFDVMLQANPYNWDPSGLTHIILATGPAALDEGEFLVRDTANIGPQGPRPGPRRYDMHKLQLVSATMVVPTWMSLPGQVNPPAPQPPPVIQPPVHQPVDVPPPVIDYKKIASDALAQLTEALPHLK